MIQAARRRASLEAELASSAQRRREAEAAADDMALARTAAESVGGSVPAGANGARSIQRLWLATACAIALAGGVGIGSWLAGATRNPAIVTELPRIELKLDYQLTSPPAAAITRSQ